MLKWRNQAVKIHLWWLGGIRWLGEGFIFLDVGWFLVAFGNHVFLCTFRIKEVVFGYIVVILQVHFLRQYISIYICAQIDVWLILTTYLWWDFRAAWQTRLVLKRSIKSERPCGSGVWRCWILAMHLGSVNAGRDCWPLDGCYMLMWIIWLIWISSCDTTICPLYCWNSKFKPLFFKTYMLKLLSQAAPGRVAIKLHIYYIAKLENTWYIQQDSGGWGKRSGTEPLKMGYFEVYGRSKGSVEGTMSSALSWKTCNWICVLGNSFAGMQIVQLPLDAFRNVWWYYPPHFLNWECALMSLN